MHLLVDYFQQKFQIHHPTKKFKLCTRYFIATDIPYAVWQNIAKIIDLANIVHEYKWTTWPGLVHQLRNTFKLINRTEELT